MARTTISYEAGGAIFGAPDQHGPIVHFGVYDVDAAIATVNLGVQSYREGKAYYFYRGTGQVSHADRSWSARWPPRTSA